MRCRFRYLALPAMITAVTGFAIPRPVAAAAWEGGQEAPASIVLAQAEAARPARPAVDAPPPRQQTGSRGSAVTYRPPRRGAPRARVGGGVRGSVEAPTPLALAPDHVGLTTHARPALFWHVNGGLSEGMRSTFTLMDEEGIDPIVETTLASPSAAGIQRIDLEVDLAPGVEHQWTIAVVVDEHDRSKDRTTTGYIRRVDPHELLAISEPTAADFAAAGLWYDALEALGDQIDADPSDPTPRELRRGLLRQAHLEAGLD